MREMQLSKEKNLTPSTLKRCKKTKRRKKTGRKKIKRQFDETRVGYFLKYEAPLEYSLILEVTLSPTADLVEAIGYASLNPLFKKPKFRRALIEFRKRGLYTDQPKKNEPTKELYYKRIRKNCVQKTVCSNE